MAQRQSAQETLDDVNRYLRTIDAHLRRYRIVIDKLTVLEGRRSAKAADERQELIVTRKDAKESYIQAKQTARGLIAMLAVADSGLAAAKEAELKLLQETFRDLDREFKSLSAAAERHELLGGSASGSGSSSARGAGTGVNGDEGGRRHAATGSTTGRTNNALLDDAIDINASTTAKLKEGLATVVVTQGIGQETATALAADREKISRISGGLDTIQGELHVSRKLIVNFGKRMATDKVIIAFTALIFLGIIGIIIFATVKPNQHAFNVPDVLKPPIAPTP